MKRTSLTLMGIIALLLLAALVFDGCGSGKKAENKKLKIAVTIVPEKAFVDAVCGDLAEVIVMVPPGYSPENFEPGPKLLAQFDKADLFFAIGVGTENAGLLTRAAEVKKLKVVRLQEAVAKVYPEIEVEPGERDEHIWLSPKRAEVMVEVIAREAGRADPGNQSAYERNARNYIVKLKELDRELKQSLAPVKNRKLIVFHPAFGYLAADYGLEMLALEEHGKEARPQRLRELIDLAKKENIKAIFYQAENSGKQAKAFAEEIGGKAVMLEPLAYDYVKNYQQMVKTITEVMQ